MFHKVRIFNKNGKLMKVLTSESLSKRHWRLFEDSVTQSSKKANKYNDFKKGKKLKNDVRMYLDTCGLNNFRFEGH